MLGTMDGQLSDASAAERQQLTRDQCYLIPYGVVGVLSDLLSLYIAVCLAMSRRPLYPKRKIRYPTPCHYVGAFILILYWSLWKENITQCLDYWQLFLINCGNAIMGLLILVSTWVMFAAHNQEATPGSRVPEPPDESEGLLNTHNAAEGPRPDVSTNMSPDAVTSPPETATSLPETAGNHSIHTSVSKLVSAIWKDSGVQVGEEAVPGHEHDHSVTASDAEAQRLVNPQERKLAPLAYLPWVALGGCILCSLIGVVALAVEANANGSRACAYFTGFFTLVFLEIAFLFCLTFRSSTPAKDRHSIRLFLLILCGAVTIVYSDLILGVTLGSITGVPFPDVPADELSRYWVYFAALKVHLFAF